MYLSIIAPVFNEENNINSLVIEIVESFKNQDFEYEIILVNDCSKDNSKERIIENMNVFDFELSAQEVSAITALNTTFRPGVDPEDRN